MNENDIPTPPSGMVRLQRILDAARPHDPDATPPYGIPRVELEQNATADRAPYPAARRPVLAHQLRDVYRPPMAVRVSPEMRAHALERQDAIAAATRAAAAPPDEPTPFYDEVCARHLVRSHRDLTAPHGPRTPTTEEAP